MQFSADPEQLRRAARALDDLHNSLSPMSETCVPNCGHSALEARLSQAVGEATSLWSGATSFIDEVAVRLRSSADLYERSDLHASTRDG